MSTLNMGLQHCSIVRGTMPPAMERLVSSANGMKDVRAAAVDNPALQPAWAEAMQQPIGLIAERFLRLRYGKAEVLVHPAGTDEQMQLFMKALQQLEPSLSSTSISRKELPKYPMLKAVMDAHLITSDYALQFFKKPDCSCPACALGLIRVVRMHMQKFRMLHPMPLPRLCTSVEQSPAAGVSDLHPSDSHAGHGVATPVRGSGAMGTSHPHTAATPMPTAAAAAAATTPSPTHGYTATTPAAAAAVGVTPPSLQSVQSRRRYHSDGTHYLKFSEVYGQAPNPADQPWLRKSNAVGRGPAAAAIHEVDEKNKGLLKKEYTRLVIECSNCAKPRCIFSKTPVLKDPEVLRTLQDRQYACGEPLFQVDHPLHSSVVVREGLDCCSHVEFEYYSSSLPQFVQQDVNMCAFCAVETGKRSKEDEAFYLTVLPVCEERAQQGANCPKKRKRSAAAQMRAGKADRRQKRAAKAAAASRDEDVVAVDQDMGDDDSWEDDSSSGDED